MSNAPTVARWGAVATLGALSAGACGSPGGVAVDGVSQAGSSGDASTDARGECSAPVCAPAASPDGGTYTSVCRATCDGLAVQCACGADSPESCFCGVGNAAPACIAGSLVDCGYGQTCGADVSADPRNCGRCGHDCGALECKGGVCQPERLGLGSGVLVNAWTGDGAFIYGAACGGGNPIFRVPIAGVPDGGAPTVLASGQACGIGIAVDAASVYWIGKSAVWRTPASGGGTVTSVDTYGPPWTGDIYPHALAIDEASIYFAVAGSGYVYAYSKSTGVRTTLVSDVGRTNTGLVAVDATSVYYTTSTPSFAIELRAVTKTGSPSKALATVPTSEPRDILVLPDGAYVGGADGGIWRVPLTGGAADPIVAPGDGVAAMASDGAALFWLTPTTTFVNVKPLGSGHVQRMALPEMGYSATLLLADATNIYWSDGVSGEFRSLPRTYRP